MKRFLSVFSVLIGSLVLFLSCENGLIYEGVEVSIVSPDWAEGRAFSYFAEAVLEEEFGFVVEVVVKEGPNMDEIMSLVADGTHDAVLDVWTDFHSTEISTYEDQLELIGAVYKDAKTGLVVPRYTYDGGITKISDLETNDVAGKEITGIDPGAGLMSVVENDIIPDYGLDIAGYTLQDGSSESMLTALADAIAAEEDIIVTLWQPHGQFGIHELEMLEEDQTSHFTPNDIQMYGRSGLSADYPELVTFMENMQFSNDEVGSLLAHIAASQLSEPDAAAEWKAENQDIWINWMAQ
ncbi:glycine betaine ABC transporter substrate-binding protein [Salinispira pacifica]|uniref:Glycine betaine ABC transport system, glycine betaine-binding protein OpuAC n=1 Tax=Salinispira pacifica TaxID=1307761 RepID=V5WFS6_9SPIO|nr:glycine betaine ABC transporter substrate-binding protein [Salinispira pacifica]AHC14419.1 Glycine betaine ABC transport system, glycine betaine-binding protein OpuAC [Salinispira pacifica]